MDRSGSRATGVATAVPARPPALAHAVLGSGMVVLGAFAATLFLSALLLFSVQPMYAKLILPKLGGSPSVWAVSMCFFQAVLLAGYAYAFALNRWLKDGQALAAHLTLMLAAGLVLPFALPVDLASPAAGEPYLWLLQLLVIGIGLPFFAVSANAPLLQAWFSRTSNPHAADPYFLYGASNLGSLLALLLYPLLIEPTIGLAAQSRTWSAGFAVLGAMIALCGLLRFVTRSRQDVARPAALASTDAGAITWSQRFGWMALAFIPSGLVIAVTTYITTDVASAPFLWVLPLALFLSTFILVFRAKLPFTYSLVCDALPAAVLIFVATPGNPASSVFALASFFFAAIICHRQLYNRRPGPEHLTEFYLWMSVGGVSGGVFSALVAPQLFISVFEFTLLMLLALLCRPGILLDRDAPLRWYGPVLIGVGGVAVMLAYNLAAYSGLLTPHSVPPFVYPSALIALLCVGLVATRNWPEHRAALVVTVIAAFSVAPSKDLTLHVERSFFGTHRVTVANDGSMRILKHGTTVHGAMRLIDDEGRPVAAPTPATYYHPTSPMARAFDVVRANRNDRPLRVGIVGLGAGSLACYAQPGEAWRLFEIDPVVVRIATDPKLFDFISRCLPNPDIVIGDARLTLAQERPQSFGYLVVDAFSSDSIPAHLLTAEALRLLLDRLDPDGLLALHVSNKYLDLVPSLTSTIALVPGAAAVLVDDVHPAGTLDRTSSRVIFVARNAAAIDAVRQWPEARPLAPTGARPWTDDYSDVLSALVRRFW